MAAMGLTRRLCGIKEDNEALKAHEKSAGNGKTSRPALFG